MLGVEYMRKGPKKKIKLNFILVEGEPLQIIADLIKLEINPIVLRYGAKPYSNSEILRMLTPANSCLTT